MANQHAESLEIERKFLVEQVPENLGAYPHDDIKQGYLCIGADGSEARLRKRGEDCTLTVKTKGDTTRGEWESAVTREQFDTLWPATEGKRLEKTRYKIPYLSHVIELDLYSGSLEGLVTAEVEFLSEQNASDFITPAWFADEVTVDKRYKNQNLATQNDF